MEYILTFGSTHNVLKAERVLKDARLEFRLMPAPKTLSKYCDLVILVNARVIERAKGVLAKGDVEPKAVYKKEDFEYVKV